MHHAAITHHQLNWRYLACDVHPDRLKEAIEGARVMGWIGLNLTVPHKLLAVKLVDELDESARQWGAVNTIRFESAQPDGSWLPTGLSENSSDLPNRARGFNTDASALTRALKEELDFHPPGSSVLLLGAGGGAGRVAALKLAADGVDSLFLINRTESKAKALADEIQGRYPLVKTEVGYPKRQVDLLLNATSVGLKAEDPLPLDETSFSLKKARTVYDMIYRPRETRLLQAAKRSGQRCANGLGMLLYQGAEAFEIWSQRPAPVEQMRQALQAIP